MNPDFQHYNITVEEEEFSIEKQQIEALDILQVDNHNYHLLLENRSFNVELLHSNFIDKILTIAVNGNAYKIEIADGYDLMVKEMGLLTNTSQLLNEIKAPMPGLILDVMVEVGQQITEGTQLLVLSAMKMENIILSQGEGIIKSIEVKKNDAVEKGQLIIEME